MNAGRLDYGSGRYKITGGSDDGYEFHAGDSLEIQLPRGHWIPVVIEVDRDGRWLFLCPIDMTLPNDLYGLPVRRAFQRLR